MVRRPGQLVGGRPGLEEDDSLVYNRENCPERTRFLESLILRVSGRLGYFVSLGDWAIVSLGDWAIVSLGDWAIVSLGDWAFVSLGDWAIVSLGDWAIVSLGVWAIVTLELNSIDKRRDGRTKTVRYQQNRKLSEELC